MDAISAQTYLNSIYGVGRFKIQTPFFKVGDIQTLAGQVSGALPNRSSILSYAPAAGQGLLLAQKYLWHIDGTGLDFLFWSILGNGAQIADREKIYGSSSFQPIPLKVPTLLPVGAKLDVYGSNWSGTGINGTDGLPYPGATDIRVAAAVEGWTYAD